MNHKNCPRESYHSNMLSTTSLPFHLVSPPASAFPMPWARAWNCGLFEDGHGHGPRQNCSEQTSILDSRRSRRFYASVGRQPSALFLSSPGASSAILRGFQYGEFSIFLSSYIVMTCCCSLMTRLLSLNVVTRKSWAASLQVLKGSLATQRSWHTPHGVPSEYAKTLSKRLPCQTLHILVPARFVYHVPFNRTRLACNNMTRPIIIL